MNIVTNDFGQPIGEPLPFWSTRPRPEDITLVGKYCSLEPLNHKRHSHDLYAAFALSTDGRDWTYMPIGPFDNESDYQRYVESSAKSLDPKHFAVIDSKTGKAVGTISLMRIDPANGVVEVGYVAFSTLLRRTIASTEAQYLLMKYVFEDMKYRRYEWKCDSLNFPSCSAAERLGFQFEGLFRQLVVYKGRTRNTTWYSIIDGEWPLLRSAFEEWLSDSNFDNNLNQRKTLGDIREAIKKSGHN